MIQVAKLPQVEPDEECVQLLEEMLAEARAGTLRGFVLTKLYLNGESQSVWVVNDIFGVHVLGALNMLVRDWEDHCIEVRGK